MDDRPWHTRSTPPRHGQGSTPRRSPYWHKHTARPLRRLPASCAGCTGNWIAKAQPRPRRGAAAATRQAARRDREGAVRRGLEDGRPVVQAVRRHHRAHRIGSTRIPAHKVTLKEALEVLRRRAGQAQEAGSPEFGPKLQRTIEAPLQSTGLPVPERRRQLGLQAARAHHRRGLRAWVEWLTGAEDHPARPGRAGPQAVISQPRPVLPAGCIEPRRKKVQGAERVEGSTRQARRRREPAPARLPDP